MVPTLSCVGYGLLTILSTSATSNSNPCDIITARYSRFAVPTVLSSIWCSNNVGFCLDVPRLILLLQLSEVAAGRPWQRF